MNGNEIALDFSKIAMDSSEITLDGNKIEVNGSEIAVDGSKTTQDHAIFNVNGRIIDGSVNIMGRWFVF